MGSSAGGGRDGAKPGGPGTKRPYKVGTKNQQNQSKTGTKTKSGGGRTRQGTK